MALTYPADCDSPEKKHAYCVRAKELLRFLYNLMSYWASHDITQAQYNSPPLPTEIDDAAKPLVRAAFTKLKNKYSYKTQLTKEDFRKFVTEDFMRISDVIETQRLKQAKELKKSANWEPSIGDM